jgi:hypothetical protein
MTEVCIWEPKSLESAPKIGPLLFEKFENTPEGELIARRGRGGPTLGPPHRRSPEEIDLTALRVAQNPTGAGPWTRRRLTPVTLSYSDIMASMRPSSDSVL